jgi:hypothetical protein
VIGTIYIFAIYENLVKLYLNLDFANVNFPYEAISICKYTVRKIKTPFFNKISRDKKNVDSCKNSVTLTLKGSDQRENMGVWSNINTRYLVWRCGDGRSFVI